MTSNIDISFLKKRITSIQTALFFTQDIGVMKIPNCVIHVLKVDDEGQVWFFIHRPRQYLFAFNENFHARLDFYKKGAACFLSAEGNVSMIDEQPDVDTARAGNQDLEWPFTGGQLMLMKMKIRQVTYYDTESAPEIPGFMGSVMKWINRQVWPKLGYGPYVIEPGEPVYRLYSNG